MADVRLLATITNQLVRAGFLELTVNYDVVVGPRVRQTVLVHSMQLAAEASEEEIQAAIAEYGEREVWPRYVDAGSGPAQNAAAARLAGKPLEVRTPGEAR